MKNKDNLTPFSRRSFIGYLSGLIAGIGLIGAAKPPLNTNNKQKKNLFDPLSPEEEKIVNASEMAREIVTLPAKGFSCAGAILTSVLKYMDKPENIADAAAAFGGGMGQKDLCGFLTGGIMAIGIAAGMKHKGRKEIKAHARKLTEEFWTWWKSMAPLHCYELSPNYKNNKEGFYNMAKRVAVKIESLIKT